MSEVKLKRVLGLPTAIATVVGLIICNTALVSAGQGFGIAGLGFIIPMSLALLLNLFVAFSFGELSSIMPRAGGIGQYTMPAMGPLASLFAVISGYVIVSIFAGSAEISIPGLIINEIFLPNIPVGFISLIMLFVILACNLRGIEFFAILQMTSAIVKIGSVVGLGLIGLLLAQTNSGLPLQPLLESASGMNPLGWGVISLTALAFWMFVGVEFVCPLAEEIKNPERNIPIAMLVSLLILFITNVLFGLAALKHVPMSQLASSAAPHVDVATALLGRAGQYIIAIVAIFASLGTVNSLIASISRMLYGMAKEGQLPKIFGVLHPKYQTPTFAILFMGACFFLPIFTGVATIEAIVILILSAAFSWFVAYIIGHLDVIILRMKYPNATRPIKSPLYPLPQLLGIAGMIYLMFNIFPDPEVKRQIYIFALGFLAIGLIGCTLLVKFVMKKNLFEVTSMEEVVKNISSDRDDVHSDKTKTSLDT